MSKHLLLRSISTILLFVTFVLAPKVQAQSNYDYPTRAPEGRSNYGGANIFAIINLINTLSQLGSSPESPKVDLSPDIADIRTRISRLYKILANQNLLLNQLPEACAALDNSYSSQLEGYLSKRLTPRKVSNSDCHGAELQRLSMLTGSPTALIYPVLLSDRLELILVSPSAVKPKGVKQQSNSTDTVRYVAHKVTETKVKELIQDFRSNLQDPNSNDYLSQSQELYKLIIRPMEPELEKAKIETLVFVMDGDLRVIPIAALHDGKKFLVEKYALSAVTTMPLTNIDQRSSTIKIPQILAMGLSEAMQGLSPLPSTPVEVNAIASKVLKGEAFLNQAFTIENLQNQYNKQGYAMIHLATHADFIGSSPNESFIQFWQERLKLSQIAGLKLNLEMLTLSACKTAVGKNLGISGVAVDSGAKSVLASLWSVSDLGTVPLMVSFYSSLANSPSKAIALQQAQLSLLKGKVRLQNHKIMGIANDEISLPIAGDRVDLTHPFFWSSFILVGNWL